MLLKSNTAANGRAIGVHIKDGKEDADAFSSRFQKFLFVDFLNVGNGAICRCDDSALIGGIGAVWIAKKSDGVENQRDKKKREPPRNQRTPDRQDKQNGKDPASFEEGLKAHNFAVIFRPKKGAVKPAKTESEKTEQRPQ